MPLPLPCATWRTPNQDPLTKIGELLGKYLPLAEILCPVGGRVEEAGLALVSRSVRVHAVGDDIVGEQIEHHVLFAALEGLEALTDDFHVLLRHPLRSISQRWLGRQPLQRLCRRAHRSSRPWRASSALRIRRPGERQHHAAPPRATKIP